MKSRFRHLSEKYAPCRPATQNLPVDVLFGGPPLPANDPWYDVQRSRLARARDNLHSQFPNVYRAVDSHPPDRVDVLPPGFRDALTRTLPDRATGEDLDDLASRWDVRRRIGEPDHTFRARVTDSLHNRTPVTLTQDVRLTWSASQDQYTKQRKRNHHDHRRWCRAFAEIHAVAMDAVREEKNAAAVAILCEMIPLHEAVELLWPTPPRGVTLVGHDAGFVEVERPRIEAGTAIVMTRDGRIRPLAPNTGETAIGYVQSVATDGRVTVRLPGPIQEVTHYGNTIVHDRATSLVAQVLDATEEDK